MVWSVGLGSAWRMRCIHQKRRREGKIKRTNITPEAPRREEGRGRERGEREREREGKD